MKYDNTIDVLKILAKALLAPEAISHNFRESDIPSNSNILDLNNNNIYTKTESDNNQYKETIPIENNESFKDNNNYSQYENNDYYNKQKIALSKEEGLLDSITKELTSARLQQAIILSEIVGKPKSKTRKRRRF